MVLMDIDVPCVAMPTVKPVVKLVDSVTAIVRLDGEVQTVSQVSFVCSVGSLFLDILFIHFTFICPISLRIHQNAQMVITGTNVVRSVMSTVEDVTTLLDIVTGNVKVAG